MASHLKHRLARLERRIPARPVTRDEIVRQFNTILEQARQSQQREINEIKGRPWDSPVSESEREQHHRRDEQRRINQARGLPLGTLVTEAERKTFSIKWLRKAGYPDRLLRQAGIL